jgi:hypothetical protein
MFRAARALRLNRAEAPVTANFSGSIPTQLGNARGGESGAPPQGGSGNFSGSIPTQLGNAQGGQGTPPQPCGNTGGSGFTGSIPTQLGQ